MSVKIKSINYQIEQKIKNILFRYLPETLFKELENRQIINQVNKKIQEDLSSFASKDPAAKNSLKYILDSYLSFKAVLHYRIANALYYLSQNANEITPLQTVARKISEQAKAETGIEIHPAAKIGRRFVVDHGFGTVIGETTQIGDDCYILQSVILGARRIAANCEGKRHPTLGNRVEVGGFVRIFGNVTIGNDVKISPCVVITKDIPANSTVVLLTTNQIIKN